MRFLIISLFLLTACGSDHPTLKVAATLIPHAQMLEVAKADLAEKDIDLEIITVEDYQTPNRALVDKDVDANFFQHTPFLEAQISQFNYPLERAAKIHIEPMGAYSRTLKSIDDLQCGSLVALPLDPTNQARALLLLKDHHLISLKDKSIPSILDLKDNSKNLQFIEVDAAMLSRTLEDVTIAFIPTNYALQAGLSPLDDALLIEDAHSPYANLLVVRQGDTERPDIQALISALKSDKMKAFLKTHYGDSILIVE